jgi:hypothetical protein
MFSSAFEKLQSDNYNLDIFENFEYIEPEYIKIGLNELVDNYDELEEINILNDELE